MKYNKYTYTEILDGFNVHDIDSDFPHTPKYLAKSNGWTKSLVQEVIDYLNEYTRWEKI